MHNKQNNIHIPVLLDDIIHFISQENNQRVVAHTLDIIIFDATFGGGGYSNRLVEYGYVHAVDADIDAVNAGIQKYQKLINEGYLKIQHARFDQGLSDCTDESFDYIIADLGFSSNQLDDSQRGFSYQKINDPLDLRYDITTGVPCWKLLYGVQDVDKLRKTIYNYSGEALSKRIAQALYELVIAKQKEGVITAEILTVGEVVDAIRSAIPIKFKKQIPAILSRVWQALRIWTNQEFIVLDNFLSTAVEKLKPSGFLMIVSFHSLEDKLVTHYFRQLAKPREIDDYGNKEQNFKLITKKALKPSQQEIENNIRSRSALLRIIQKL